MNKFYIQIVLFLLTISLYVNNKTLATEDDPGEDTVPKPLHCSTSEEIYEKNKHLLRNDPKETIQAYIYMNKALNHLDHHSTSHTDVEKIQYTIDDPNKYNEIINELWDPDHPNFLNTGSVKSKYFYALFTKVEISENITIIAYGSANINNHNPSNKKYKNEIVKEANLLKTNIDSEEDIRKGKLKKTFVNWNLIKKRSKCVNITYIKYIDRYTSI
ncbi:hypothetical protein YYC_02401 [Plasmodium yoelii 17X]|uniref:Fam-a protein n=1 Tax=Plasmodium yoelii 17X TaxID=1323249 RepID=V7PNT5_PLAYE|nr:hypothetical protein YYC_02401 [Plasmodium yoelii 17X]